MRLLHDDRALSRIFQIGMLILACQWGLDYMLDPPKNSLYVFERTIPAITLWGGLLFTLGMMGIIGELWIEIGARKHSDHHLPPLCASENRWWPSFTAHLGLCACYFGIAIGSALEMAINGHLYGIRMVGSMTLLTFGHYVYMQRRRHAP